MWIIFFHLPHLLKGSKEGPCESSPVGGGVFTSIAEILWEAVSLEIACIREAGELYMSLSVLC